MANIQVDVLITVSINTEVWWKHFAPAPTLQFSSMMQFSNTGLEFSPPVHDQSEVSTSLRITSNLPPSIVRREKRSEQITTLHSSAAEDTPICLEAHVSQLEVWPYPWPSSERSWCGRPCVLLEIYFPEFWCRSIWSPAPQEIISQTWVQQTTLCPGIQVAKLVLQTWVQQTTLCPGIQVAKLVLCRVQLPHTTQCKMHKCRSNFHTPLSVKCTSAGSNFHTPLIVKCTSAGPTSTHPLSVKCTSAGPTSTHHSV